MFLVSYKMFQLCGVLPRSVSSRSASLILYLGAGINGGHVIALSLCYQPWILCRGETPSGWLGYCVCSQYAFDLMDMGEKLYCMWVVVSSVFLVVILSVSLRVPRGVIMRKWDHVKGIWHVTG